ncbi:MAG TPA: hypothetical protein VJ998_06345, partial [Pseudomonadales bacterium]|nr:hypothetical protein [Pseudomonadales bacterium]
AERRATHLLTEDHAVPIGHSLRLGIAEDGSLVLGGGDVARCTLYTRGKQTLMDNHSGSAIQLNGEPSPPQADVNPGDKLTIDGHTLTLISVG